MNWFRNQCERRCESLCLLASGALPEPEARELEAHLAACAACRKYFAEVKEVAAPLAGWEKSFARIEPGPAVKERWLKAIATATLSSSGARTALSARTDGKELADKAVRAPEPAPVRMLRKLWFELVWPARRIWAGLAAVWVALAIFHLTQADRRETAVAKSTAPAAEVRLAFQEQQRLLAEILGPPPVAVPVEPPRRNLNQPRSDLRRSVLIV